MRNKYEKKIEADTHEIRINCSHLNTLRLILKIVIFVGTYLDELIQIILKKLNTTV